MSKPTTSWSHKDPYNPEFGLWTQSTPGHTKPVAYLSCAHSGPDAASRLLVAAQRGALRDFPTLEVLKALSGLQVRDGSALQGCCRWYAEEPAPVDTNASFFIALNLIVLNAAYRSNLSTIEIAILDEMLEAFIAWFKLEAEEGKVHYPNKYLGDLVCLWLLCEQTATATDELVPLMAKSAQYWKETHWGWGEHMSDCYSSILLDELSSFLLLAKEIPEHLRLAYTDLFKDLIAIEDAFDEGPRVPTIRTYALNGQMSHENYRKKIVSIDPNDPPDHNPRQVPHLYRFPFGHVLKDMGWHELAGPKEPKKHFGEIACYGDTRASYIHSGKLRMGALSKFPIMPNTDQPTWGMSWQSMPIALSSRYGDWGFWRWGTRESGLERFYPAKDKRSAYLKNSLTDTVSPVISGQTFSQVDGTSILALRRMPQISKAWEWCSDTFTLHDFSGNVRSCEALDHGWHQLVLELPDKLLLTIQLHTLESKVTPDLSEQNDSLTWTLQWAADELESFNQLSCLWHIHLGEAIPAPPSIEQTKEWLVLPTFTPGDARWSVDWQGSEIIIDHRGLSTETSP